MAAARPNLARRPFVDSRPANAVAAVLLVAAVVLTVTSVRTVRDYLEGSRRSREAVAALRVEISRLEAGRQEAEKKLARFDLEGLRAGTEEANALAALRTFSWTRFLTRLEKTLPFDVRVVSIAVGAEAREGGKGGRALSGDTYTVTLQLVSRDPDAFPRLVRTFYGSPWFDAPTPVSEAGGDKGETDGRSLALEVLYRDAEGKR